MITVNDVRRIAGNLPGAYEQETYGGSPSWRTKPRMFTWIRDDGVLVIWVASVEEKQELIAADPDKFFTTAHYDNAAIVLVRMSAINVDELAELLEDSWRLRSPRSVTSRHVDGDINGRGTG